MTDNPRCNTCRFWESCNGLTQEIRDGDPPTQYGWCHRNPPVPLRDGASRRSLPIFPATNSFEWCGEHRPSGDSGPGKHPEVGFERWKELVKSRAFIVCAMGGMSSWEELYDMSLSELRSLRQMGPVTFGRLLEAIREFGGVPPDKWTK